MDNSILTQERLKELLHYNPNTGIFTWIKCPNNKTNLLNKPAGHKRKISKSNKYELVEIRINTKSYLAHRLAWLYVYGYIPKLLDHINRIPYDNRICNLREASKQTNAFNTKLSKNNTTGHKGVYFDKRSKKFIAECVVFKKRYYLGSFYNLELAIQSYESFAKIHHGKFYVDKSSLSDYPYGQKD